MDYSVCCRDSLSQLFKIKNFHIKIRTAFTKQKHRERYRGVFYFITQNMFWELPYSDYGYAMSGKSKRSIECYFLSTTIFTTTIRQAIKLCQR